MSSGACVSLDSLRPGQGGRVHDFVAGQGARARLMSLGLIHGQPVRIVVNDGFGPVIIALGTARVAVGRGLAAKVRVVTDSKGDSL